MTEKRTKTTTRKTNGNKGATAARATRTATAKSTTARTTTKKTTTRTRTRKVAIVTTPEDRHRMIEEAAYYRAEQRGFMGGDPQHDWIEAEAEIDRMLHSGATV